MDCIEPEQVKIKKIINGALIIATPPNKIPRWCFLLDSDVINVVDLNDANWDNIDQSIFTRSYKEFINKYKK